MQNSNGLPNFLRLSGLKNVSGRRVMPGELPEEQDVLDNEIPGTAQKLPNFANFAPPTANQPEADLGGELNSQAYDVRANAVVPPEQTPQEENAEEPGFFRKLGNALASYTEKRRSPEMKRMVPVEETMANSLFGKSEPRTNEERGLPPYMVLPPTWEETINPTKRDQRAQENELKKQMYELHNQGKDFQEVKAQYDQLHQKTVADAVEEPWKYSVDGANEEVANSPELRAQFQEITGQEYNEQIQEQVNIAEQAMKASEDALRGEQDVLDERAQAINDRIARNESTEADKYYIGLALLMPLLIGGFFGKEAGLGALAGTAKGYGDILQGKQKGIREDEQSLLDISKQKSTGEEKLANINLEKAKLGPALKKAMPMPNEHLQGMREAKWTDPETGKEVKGVEVLPGFVAKPQFISSPEGKANMMKAANELSSVKSFVDEVDTLTSDVITILDQLDDKSKASKAMTSYISGIVPGSLSALTQDVVVNGQKVNAGVALEQSLGFLANAYGMAKEIGQLDRAAQSHIKKIIDNPTSTLLTPTDSLNQMLQVRKLVQNSLKNSAKNKGFYPNFALENSALENRKLYSGINAKADKKEAEKIKTELMQEDINYAQ